LNKRPSNIAIAYRFIEELKGNSKNPRKHSDRQLNALVKSIKCFGFNIPIAVNAQSEILCGHARIEAAKKLGIKEVPVIRLDHLSESQARAFMLADNKLSEMGSWDQKFLKVHLQELSSVDLNFDIEVTGFTVGEIDLILDSDPKSDRADKAIVLKEGPAITQLGDLWALGEHRMLCADARLEKSYEVLLEDKKAAMVISDHITFQSKDMLVEKGKFSIVNSQWPLVRCQMENLLSF
jgi:ParB-like nuclease domain